MSDSATREAAGEIEVTLGEDFVGVVEFSRPPRNHFSAPMLASIATEIERLQEETDCRAVLLCAKGRHFCAGAELEDGAPAIKKLYDQGVRLFETRLPIVAALQGASVGGGLGLALVADFRIATPESRLIANFSRLGIHHGFGLSVTLPRVVGHQRALDMLLTGRDIRGDEALEIGLVDRLASLGDLREAAHEMAAEIAAQAPLGVAAMRATLRGHLADEVRSATAHEREQQTVLFDTEDHREAMSAMAERRPGQFNGR